MKTRQELILDFMLALSANINIETFPAKSAEWVFTIAAVLADEYLENV